jgi:hypothetical protein
MINVTLAALSSAGFGIYIASQSSHHDSVVVSMTPYLHCTTVKSSQQHHHQHDSTTSSPAWFDIYTVSRPGCPDSAVVSITRHLHRTMTKSSRQHYRQRDSTSISRHGQVTSTAPSSAWLEGLASTSPTSSLAQWFTTNQALGLRSNTPTDSPAWVHFYLHRWPRLEARASSPQ